jgi:perosamine synthetase
LNSIPLCVPSIGEDEIQSVVEVLRSGWLAHGQKNHEFESMFADYIGTKYAISMNSCTSALYLALAALEITGEVIAPSFTFVATVNAILLAGAVPVLVDIDPDTRNMDPDRIEEAITDRTEAIMVVHYGGLPANMPRILEIAEKHDLRIIEDSAECLGGSFHGQMAGSCDVGCFSFFPTKNITTGEGGMLTTSDDKLAAKVRAMCAHGIDSTTFAREKKERPWIRIATSVGHNFRMSNILAAIGVEQMRNIDALNHARRTIAQRYIQHLGNLDWIGVQTPPDCFVHSWQMFTILVPQEIRDGLLKNLRANGIEASVHFDPPVHEQSTYNGLQRESLEATERVAKSILSLPVFPTMCIDDVDRVCDVIRAYEVQ